MFGVNPSLDSSLKKNTAFIKRLRTAISTANLSTFLQEIKTLSLHKYLSEIVSACYEGVCRIKSQSDLDAATEIISALHQRFGPAQFTGHLAWLLGKGLATPDKSFLKTLSQEGREREEKERMARQRALLRVATELWLVQALRTFDDAIKPEEAVKSAGSKPADSKAKAPFVVFKGGSADAIPIDVLKDLLGHDREHANLPILVMFVKAYSWDLLSIKPNVGGDGRRAADDESGSKGTEGSSRIALADSTTSTGDRGNDDLGLPLAPEMVRTQVKNILQRYFDDAAAHVLKDQKAIQSLARRNAEVYVRSGEVFEDRQANFERQVKAQDRLISNVQVLADVLGVEMPDLKAVDDESGSASGGIGLVKTGEYLRAMGEGPGIWEDEEQRRFYENLVDLKGKVPAILLEDIKKKKSEGEDNKAGKRTDGEGGSITGGDNHDSSTASSTEQQSANGNDATSATDDNSTVIANKSIGAQVEALLARLPNLTTKEAVDQAAVDFCFVNSKASRNRLVKALCDVPKGRTDLLAPWSRLVATLGRYMPDIPKAMVDHLDSEFRSLQRRKEKEFLGQVRLVNVQYLGELTKFGIVPDHIVFHSLKVSLDDFSRRNIEIMCHFLENCGRYLFRNAETAPRMASFLETLQRKKAASHIGQQERMLIENAVYYVDPPQTPAIQQKERTPMDMYIRQLIHTDLCKRNYGKILKQIRRLHWEEPAVVQSLMKVFTKPVHVKYGNIQVLAILLGALYRYHPAFVVRVMDSVIESIYVGLEQNDYRFYQKRLADVRYLAELYNYRLLEHPVIFDVAYRIIMFGYGAGYPIPGLINPLDQPNEFFRVRLVTTILETCGTYFQRGAAGKKLDDFLCLFQYYILAKDPLPMDVEFLVQDMFALVRPKWTIAANLEEAINALGAAAAQNREFLGISAETAAEVSEGAISDVSSKDGTDDDDDGEDGDDDDDNDDDGDGDDDGDADEEMMANEEDKQDVEEGPAVDEYGYDDASDDEGRIGNEAQIDPEEAAEFDRELAKMMNEGLDMRKRDRKPIFDLALPVRPKTRSSGHLPSGASPSGADEQNAAGIMAFSLLTRKGNRQQSKTVALPSDSNFAVAMRHQQQAEREEQRRIKTLVLNYDLGENEDEEDDNGT